MAERAVTFLIENMKQLLTSNPELISGTENELEKLVTELISLKAYLNDATKKSKQNEAYVSTEMEKKMRKMVYQIEDTIDSSSYMNMMSTPTRKRDFILKAFNSKRSTSSQLAKVVKCLRQDKVKSMMDKLANMQITDGSGTSGAQEPSPKVKEVPSMRKENVVVLDEAEWTITNYLKEETNELDIISITGMFGLGKTTLAWKIFQSEKIALEFPTRVWIYVSRKFNRKDLFLTILKEFTNEDMSYMSDVELVVTVRGYLETGKFMLVMDDLWNIEAWNDIQDALPRNNSKGKVLITTRNAQVAAMAIFNREPYMLPFLTEEESWELLQIEIFGKLDGCPMELIEIGRYIAKQCDGLPLAVVVIGKVLIDKLRTMDDTIKEWTNISENVSTRVGNNNVSEIVAMCYNDLPDELRDCFIYLGAFPKGHEIVASTLTRLWVAEGFVQEKEGQSLEETAKENLNELVIRNLVVVDKKNVPGKIKICHVHDIIREFCISKAAIGEYNLYQEMEVTEKGVSDPPVSYAHKCRRLCISPITLLLILTTKKDLRVRSFLCFSKEIITLTSDLISKISKACHLVRVLEFKASIKFNTFPAKLTRLIHLRYVTLSCDDLDVLPESISGLWNLQTLIVDTKSRTLTIDANIWKMIQLRRIYTEASIILAVKGDGKASENLQALNRLSPECCTEDVFNKARHLKELGIRGRLDTLLDATSLDKLDRLENLKLLNDIYPESESQNPLHDLPKSNWFPQNLKKLTISGTYLDWEHMSTLGMINTLEVLKLKDNAFRGEYWHPVRCGFPRLKFLQINHTNLVSWEASRDEFPSLNHLMLNHAEKLDEIPKKLVKRLEKLYLYRVSKSATESAKKLVFMIGYKQRQKSGIRGGPQLFIDPEDY